AAKPSRRLTGVAEASDPTFPEHAVHPVPAPKRLSSRISNWRRSVSGYEGVFAASRPATGCPRASRYGDKIVISARKSPAEPTDRWGQEQFPAWLPAWPPVRHRARREKREWRPQK